MANQDELLSLQSLNLREDEATAEGTGAIRYLVQRLQEANSNPALGPTVQALLQHQLVGTSLLGEFQPKEAIVHTTMGDLSTGDLEHMQPPRETHVERSPKRQRLVSNSSLEESGQSRRGRFHRSCTKRSPIPQIKEAEEGEPHTQRRGGSPTSKKSYSINVPS